MVQSSQSVEPPRKPGRFRLARCELHGLSAGAACQPSNPGWTIPQYWNKYSTEEHATWKALFSRQTKLLADRACDAYLEGLRRLPLAPDQIPDFDALSEALYRQTRWQVVAVPGLIPDDVFFSHLAARRFPAGQFIRRRDQLDYLQEPDVFHDVFGHVPMLMTPAIADFVQAYGEGGLKAHRKGVLALLARVYWYTVEFGLIRQNQGLRIYGAGILSSFTECRFALGSASPHRLAFDLARVMRTRYRIDDFQACYFVLERLEDLLALAEVDFTPFYARASHQCEILPTDLEASDIALHKGSGDHHQTSHA
jgi:phenylalanine-4-hydroxylase